jgi:hypothetical protein
MKLNSTTLSLFGSKSKVKAKGGGRLQAVKSVTVPGKCSAISDSDWTVFPKKNLTIHLFCVCLKIFCTNCTDSHLRGLLYVTVLKIYISNYGYLFGTATYLDYLTFSHLNPITNPTPLPNATLTIRATARNPNYWGSRVYPNYRGSHTQP